MGGVHRGVTVWDKVPDLFSVTCLKISVSFKSTLKVRSRTKGVFVHSLIVSDGRPVLTLQISD